MEFVIPLWVLAVVAGLYWSRPIVATATAVTLGIAAAVMARQGLLTQVMGWLELFAMGTTPWLLAAQRVRYQQRLKRLQAREALQLNALQQRVRSLSHLQGENQGLEARIIQITDLYHVSKETARALRVEDLFGYALEILPRLLTIEGLRLIDVGDGQQPTAVYRATRSADGRLTSAGSGVITPVEQAVLDRAAQSTAVGRDSLTSLTGESSPAELSWVGLRSEGKLIGVLIVEGLSMPQLDILAIVGNQIALQLARVHFYQAIERMAVTDSLTGVFVRRYFQELAAEELQRSVRHRLPCTFIMVDLDLFKAKNDTYGHLVGDTVLREVARLIRQNLREIDLMARYGGEEFIILLVETGPEQAMLIAERLRQVLEVTSIRAYDEAIRQTVSVGVACFPEDGRSLPELMTRADEALYAAKRSGRNKVLRWTAQVLRGESTRANRVA